MRAVDRLTAIRQGIRDAFRGYGADPSDEVRETVLVRNGCYCGRRFDCDGLEATWFVEENQIKFRGRDGELLSVCDDAERLGAWRNVA